MRLLTALMLVGMLGVMLAAPARALTQLTLYVDEAGMVEFLGTSDASTLVLPAGVNVTNGRVSGQTTSLTQKQGPVWTVDYTLGESELIIILPEGAVIAESIADEVSLQQNRLALYGRTRVRAQYTIERADGAGSSNAAGVIVVLLVVGVVAYVFRKRLLAHRVKPPAATPGTRTRARGAREARSARTAALLHQVLHERENLIVSKLRAGGKTKMSYLRKACGLPKASFSRHVHELAKKQLVKLSGEGKNKFVELASR